MTIWSGLLLWSLYILHILTATSLLIITQQQHSPVSAEEAGTADGLLLTKADEPMEKRQRRIKQLVEDMPAVLKAAEDAEAVAAAAAKASQTELPSPEKVVLTPIWKPGLKSSRTFITLLHLEMQLKQHVQALITLASRQRDSLVPKLFQPFPAA